MKTDTEIEKIVANVAAIMSFEGAALDEQNKEDLRRMLRGEISADDLIGEIEARHGLRPAIMQPKDTETMSIEYHLNTDRLAADGYDADHYQNLIDELFAEKGFCKEPTGFYTVKGTRQHTFTQCGKMQIDLKGVSWLFPYIDRWKWHHISDVPRRAIIVEDLLDYYTKKDRA